MLRTQGGQGAGAGTGDWRGGKGRGSRPFMPHPFAPSPEGAAYLDLGSFIFEFQTFLDGNKQAGSQVGAEVLPAVTLPLHTCP